MGSATAVGVVLAAAAGGPAVPAFIGPTTLKGLPAPEMLRLLQIKTQQKGDMPRLSELHLLLRACKEPGMCLGWGGTELQAA